MINRSALNHDIYKLDVDGCAKATLDELVLVATLDFYGNMGFYIDNYVEFQTLLDAFTIGLQLRFTLLCIEIDSKIIINLTTDQNLQLHPLVTFVNDCKHLLAIIDFRSFKHVYREANIVADKLANFGFSLDLVLHQFTHVPLNIYDVYFGDAYFRMCYFLVIFILDVFVC